MIHLFRDRLGSSVNQAVVHGVIISLVDVENYKKKMAMQVSVSSCNVLECTDIKLMSIFYLLSLFFSS